MHSVTQSHSDQKVSLAVLMMAAAEKDDDFPAEHLWPYLHFMFEDEVLKYLSLSDLGKHVEVKSLTNILFHVNIYTMVSLLVVT